MKPPERHFKNGLLYHRRLIKERKNSFSCCRERRSKLVVMYEINQGLGTEFRHHRNAVMAK